MQKLFDALDKLILWLTLPILLFLTAWWSSIGHIENEMIFAAALAGFAAGLLLDALVLKKYLQQAYTIRTGVLIAVFIFYSICTFGFFMGVPVFNLLPGMAAGSFMGRKLACDPKGSAKAKAYIKKTSLVTTAVMAFICASAAFLALQDPADTARNLEGMLKLQKYSVSLPILLGIILIGGILLIAMQYILTRATALWRYGKSVQSG